MKADDIITVKREISTAILVDGGFYRKRAYYFWGEKSPKERADELYDYCMKLLHNQHEQRYLYRIFTMIAHLLKKMFIIHLQREALTLQNLMNTSGLTNFSRNLKAKERLH